MIFYLLHEYTDLCHPDYPLGKKFARTAILGFIIYYVLYFVIPLYAGSFAPRLQHFLKYLVIIDILASSIFYGGIFNSLSFWSTGETVAWSTLSDKRLDAEPIDRIENNDQHNQRDQSDEPGECDQPDLPGQSK